MRIAIIGSGNIGSTVARLLVKAGHEVVISNRRGPQSLVGLVEELGPAARAATVDEAARSAELVVVAIPLGAIDELPAAAFAGKLVVDANNYYAQRDGRIPALDRDETTSTELLAQHLAGGTLVKGFNTMYYGTLACAGDPTKPHEERLAVYLAGDDARAKEVVSHLIDQIGFAPFDGGGLADGRLMQPGSPVYGADLTAAQAREQLGR